MFEVRSRYGLTLVVSTLLFGCERKMIHGRVVDNFGRPVARAHIQIEGSGFSTNADSQGVFELNYAPGTLQFLVSADGCLSWRHTLTISTHSRYPIGTVELLRLPPASDDVAVQGRTQYEVVLAKPLTRSERIDSRDPNFGTEFGCRFFDPPENIQTFSGARFTSLMPTRSYTTAIFQTRDGHIASEVLGGMLGPRRNCPNAVRLSFEPVTVDGFDIYKVELAPGTYCIAGIEGMTGGPNFSHPFYCFRWIADTHGK